MPGRFGQAFRFGGLNGEVGFGTNAGNFGKGDFTIAYWVNTTNQAIMYLLSKWPFCGHASFWEINMNMGNTGMETDQDAFGTSYLAVGITNSVGDNQWHHVAYVRRGVNLYCYRDAVLRGSNSSNFVAQIANTALLKAGTSPCVGINGSVRYSGLLDEIKQIGRRG